MRCIATLVFLLLPSPVLACVCGYMGPQSGFAVSDAVFSGKVIRSSKSKWIVEVDRVWKGEVESQIELFDANAGTSCSTRGFKKGRSYLFAVDIENKDGKIRYYPQPCNFWTVALKRTKITVKETQIIVGEGEGAKWAEEWVLMGQGEGRPPLTRN